jgi:hypothetical protein
MSDGFPNPREPEAVLAHALQGFAKHPDVGERQLDATHWEAMRLRPEEPMMGVNEYVFGPIFDEDGSLCTITATVWSEGTRYSLVTVDELWDGAYQAAFYGNDVAAPRWHYEFPGESWE